MNKDRGSKSFSLKGLLIFIIPSVIVLTYLYYIKQDVKSNDNWIPLSEINEVSSFESFDNSYMYCASYNNIQNEKLITMLFIFFLLCLVITLIIVFMVLLGKSNREKNKYNVDINKQNKSDVIISKFVDNDIELKTQQLLGDEFKNIVYDVFCALQMACMNFDYNTLRKLLTDELYNNYCASMDVLKTKSRKNIFSDFELINAKFVEIIENDEKSSIKVHLKVKFYGYIIDTNTNEIVKGSKEEKITSIYMLNLVKYKKTKEKSSNWIISEKEKVNED